MLLAAVTVDKRIIAADTFRDDTTEWRIKHGRKLSSSATAELSYRDCKAAHP